jgi:hypothetical protein
VTAEVGVMNTYGVALAADSAITIGESGKIYPSAEKLFLLANGAPVGMMIYGRATVMGLPWETVIKVYRRKLGRTTFDTLNEYVTSFLSFLKEDGTIFSAAAQENLVEVFAREVYHAVFHELSRRLDDEIRERDSLSDQDLALVLAGVVRDELDRVRQLEPLSDLPENLAVLVEDRYADRIGALRDTMLGSFPIEDETKQQLVRRVVEAIGRKQFLGTDSGVVIAGFGESEYLLWADYECRRIATQRRACRDGRIARQHHQV